MRLASGHDARPPPRPLLRRRPRRRRAAGRRRPASVAGPEVALGLTALLAALGALLAVEAAAVAGRLPGLGSLLRGAPRLLALAPALLAPAALAAAVALGGAAPTLLGVAAGLLLAPVLASLRPLHPDRRLLAHGRSLDLPDHPDSGALLLLPPGPPRAVAIAAHGGGNDRTFGLWMLVERLLARDVALLLAHLPGHGEGGRDELTLARARARVDALVAAARGSAPAPVVLVGQSLGGSFVLDAVARGVPVDAAASISAPCELALGVGLARELGALLRAPLWRALRYATPGELLPAVGEFRRRRFPVRVAAGSRYLAVFRSLLDELALPARLGGAGPTPPLLLVHGRADGIIPVAQGRRLAAALGERASYRELSRLHHLEPLFDERVLGALERLVDRVAAPPAL